MADIVLSATVQRDLLGLAALNVNDGIRYKVSADQFMGAQMQWNRNQVASAYVDGQVTVSRSRQNVMEPMGFEVYRRASDGTAGNESVLQANEAELIAAFMQDNFTFTVTIGAATYQWQCEAADFTVTWSGPRRVAKQSLIVFTVPRQPVPLAGGV